MPERKIESRFLSAKDIGWILSTVGDLANREFLEASFKAKNLSHAIRVNGKPSVIIVMIIGQAGHYVSLLWTDNSYAAIKHAMLYFRALAQKTTVLFHTKGDIIKNHRCMSGGLQSGKRYYQMVV